MATIHNQRDLGAAVRERRHDRGWTQATLARKLGVTRDWVIDLEAGRGNPQLRYLLRALNVLGLQLSVDRDDQVASFKTAGATRTGSRVHREVPVVDLDEVLAAQRRRD